MRFKIWLLVGIAFFSTVPAYGALNISTDPTKAVTCSNNVCIATGKYAVLNSKDLQKMLASSDVKVKTGGGAMTIGVLAPVTWASTSRLSLTADMSIHFNAPVIVEGDGNVSLSFNPSAGGLLSFVDGGKLDFWSLFGKLTVNTVEYTLFGDIVTLATFVKKNPQGAYALAKDYDASFDQTYTQAPVQTQFVGTFEGLGHSVSNLKVNVTPTTNRYIGFFAQLGANSAIRNFGVDNIQFSTPDNIGYIVGALVGYNGTDSGGGGTIYNSHASGTITAASSSNGVAVGGLAGFNGYHATIMNSHSDCTITITGSSSFGGAGGLASYNGGTISNSYATGSISGGTYIGGLVVSNFGQGTIVNSYATGSLYLPYSGTVGGIVEENNDGATISHSYSNVTITNGPYGNATMGGLAGINGGNGGGGVIEDSHADGTLISSGGAVGGVAGINPDGGKIIRTYATGAVTGTSGDIGGLVGFQDDYGTIDQSFATGTVRGTTGSTGGLMGDNEGTITNSYALGTTRANQGAYVGGLVGRFDCCRIYTSYSAGKVSGKSGGNSGGLVGGGSAPADDVIASYWDVSTSHQKTSHGGVGLSDKQLKSGLPPSFDAEFWAEKSDINNGLPYLIANPPPK